MELRQGELIRASQGVYRVQAVNASRALCMLVSGTGSKLISISPQSSVIRVSEDELTRQKETTMTTAAIPTGKADKVSKLARKPAGEARPLGTKATDSKAASTPKRVRSCRCGCGEETMSFFVPGHDARYKSWLQKLSDGRLDLNKAKALMGQEFGKYTWRKTPKGYAPAESYRDVRD